MSQSVPRVSAASSSRSHLRSREFFSPTCLVASRILTGRLSSTIQVPRIAPGRQSAEFSCSLAGSLFCLSSLGSSGWLIPSDFVGRGPTRIPVVLRCVRPDCRGSRRAFQCRLRAGVRGHHRREFSALSGFKRCRVAAARLRPDRLRGLGAGNSAWCCCGCLYARALAVPRPCLAHNSLHRAAGAGAVRCSTMGDCSLVVSDIGLHAAYTHGRCLAASPVN